MCKMRKFIAIAIVAAMIASLGAAFAQGGPLTDSQRHLVTITIPDVVLIRITGSDHPSVSFAFGETAYVTAVEAAPALAGPTDVSGFSDVVVFANRATWRVNVEASALTGGPVGLLLSDILVHPSRDTGANVNPGRIASFGLATSPLDIASGVRTSGWRSLGFNGWDYRLALQGDEGAGTFTTTVTYTIVSP